MDRKQGAVNELQRAIERFEAAASRRRPLPAFEPVRRSRRQRVRWHRLPLAAVAAVLLSSLAAGRVIVLERAESPAVELSARAEPDDGGDTVVRDSDGGAVNGDGRQTAIERSGLPTDPEPLLAGTTELPVDLFATRELRRLGVHSPGEAEEPRVLFASGPNALQVWDADLLDRPHLSQFVLGGEHGDSDRAATWSAEETRPAALIVSPPQVPSRGVMTDSAAPLVDVLSVNFALYEEPSGGVPLWLDFKTVQADVGGYAALLAGTTELPVDLFATREPRRLRVHPLGEAEQPRVRFTSLPNATQARDADLLDRSQLSKFVLRGEHPDGDRAATWSAAETRPSARIVSPSHVPSRGVMTDSAGAPLVDFPSAIFALDEEPSGGVPMWVGTETGQADAVGGDAVVLGGTTELPVDPLATGGPRRLGVHPPGEAEQPRVRFASVPNATQARDADLLDRPQLSKFVLGGEHPDGDRAASWSAEETRPSALIVASPHVPYRGVMTGSAGAPLVGSLSAIFALYEEPSGGVPLWVDIKTVQADAVGGYAVVLGGTTELPVDLFATGEPRWLGVQPAGEDEQPRVRFTNVPKALQARDADLLDRSQLSKFVLGGEHPDGDRAATWSAAETRPSALIVSPPHVSYRGVMTDSAGAPLVGVLSAIFALYAKPSGGVPLWVDIKTVQADADGGYAVVLGGTTELPVDLFATGEPRWLGVQPAGEDEQPRVRFTRVPKAVKPRDANLLDRRPLSEFVLLRGEHSHGNVALGKYDSCHPPLTMLAGGRSSPW